jgi:mono/diheme cytochrome c family protein
MPAMLRLIENHTALSITSHVLQAKVEFMTRLLASAALLAFAAHSAGAADDTGARIFLNHCAACHGEQGEGGGPVAATMNVAIPNLRTLAARSDGTFPADAVTAYIDGREITAAHGDRQMPIWGDVFRGPEQGTAQRTVRRRIDALVEFIAMLQYPR